MFVAVQSQLPGPGLEDMRNSGSRQNPDKTPAEFDRVLPKPARASLPNEVAEQHCTHECRENSERETRCRRDPKHGPGSPLASRRSPDRRFFQRVREPGAVDVLPMPP